MAMVAEKGRGRREERRRDVSRDGFFVVQERKNKGREGRERVVSLSLLLSFLFNRDKCGV